MGFPVGYSEFMLPKFLLQLVFLLGHVRRLISLILAAAGLGNLFPEPGISAASPAAETSSAAVTTSDTKPSAAALIQEMLPVALVRDLEAEGWSIPESCAVCLQEFSAAEEVRLPGNCRHIFHRSCIDRWMEHDQTTCPLCRTLLLPEDLLEASLPSFFEELDFAGADDPAFSVIQQFLSPPFALSS